jgi:hypothetical protein
VLSLEWLELYIGTLNLRGPSENIGGYTDRFFHISAQLLQQNDWILSKKKPNGLIFLCLKNAECTYEIF